MFTFVAVQKLFLVFVRHCCWFGLFYPSSLAGARLAPFGHDLYQENITTNDVEFVPASNIRLSRHLCRNKFWESDDEDATAHIAYTCSVRAGERAKRVCDVVNE